MCQWMSVPIEQLLHRIARQDEAALALLYAQFSTPVYSLALQILRDPGLAQEVTQDTFMKVWQHPRAWDSAKGQFSSWLLTTARYTAIDRLRREIRRTGRDSALDETAAAEDVDEAPHRDLQQLHVLLSELPSEQRQVVELAYFQGLKHSELAERLAIPLGTVKTRLRLGLQKLKRMLLDKS